MTPFSKKCEIIAKLWVEQEEDMSEFWAGYDLSTPIAFGIYDGWVTGISEKAKSSIEKLFDDILEYHELEDTGFTDWLQVVGE